MKVCPKCAEHIQDAALVCRYCGAKQSQTDWKFVLVLLGIIMVVAVAGGSNDNETTEERDPVLVGESVIAEPYDKYTASRKDVSSRQELGPKITVWSDTKATYTDEGSGALDNGNLWIITRRAGPSGVSFAKREIDCQAETFRYLGEGNTREDISTTADANMGQLTEGSISTLVSDYACKKHGRGSVAGI